MSSFHHKNKSYTQIIIENKNIFFIYQYLNHLFDNLIMEYLSYIEILKNVIKNFLI